MNEDKNMLSCLDGIICNPIFVPMDGFIRNLKLVPMDKKIRNQYLCLWIKKSVSHTTVYGWKYP